MKTVALAVAVVNNQKLFSPRKYYKYQEPHFLYSSIEKESLGGSFCFDYINLFFLCLKL